ncbi:hypothetical protein [Rhodohalobacter sp. 8-1]|uniref:hypothetical protein n=1 Tax=Rhodohalobacter sp. 8-1 TaxID=3131972 RepID=UPI0030EE0639
MIYRFVTRLLAKGRTAGSARQRPQFDPSSNGTETNRSSRKKNLDQIEDAEYEDITEKEKK